MSDNKSRFCIEVYDREELMINQVLHILRFDEESVTLMTSQGRMLVEGKDLVIENLNHDNGTALIKGSIYSIYFSKKDNVKGKGPGRKQS